MSHLLRHILLSSLAGGDVAFKDEQIILMGQLRGVLLEDVHGRSCIRPGERQAHMGRQAVSAKSSRQNWVRPAWTYTHRTVGAGNRFMSLAMLLPVMLLDGLLPQ